MRVLIDYAFDYVVDLRTYSVFNDLRDFARSSTEKRKDIFFYFVLPKFYGEEHLNEIKKLMLEESDNRIEFIVKDYTHRNVRETFFVREEWAKTFNHKNQEYFYDVILTNRFSSTYHLKRLYQKCVMYDSYEVKTPIVIYHGFGAQVINTDFPYTEEDYILNLANCLTCWEFVNPYEYNLRRKYLSKYFSASSSMKILNRTLPLHSSIGTKYIDREIKNMVERKKGDKIRLFWGGRPCSMKRFDDVLAVYKKVYESGRNVSFTICVPQELPPNAKDYPFIEWIENCKRDVFINKSVNSDLFVALSSYETPGFAYLEMLYSGLVGVYKKEDWVVGLMPNYPLIENSIDSVTSRVMWCIDNFDKAKEAVDKSGIVKWISETFDIDKVTEKRLSFFDRVLSEEKTESAKQITDLIGKCTKGINKISMSDLLCRMKEESDSKRDFGSEKDGMFTKFYIRKAAENSGFYDNCQSKEIVFERRA